MTTLKKIIGERGKDYHEIWHAPTSPNERIKTGDGDRFIIFRNGLFVAPDETASAIVAQANKRDRYIPADPDQVRPIVCDECGLPWFSATAFSKHMRYAHGNRGVARK